MPQVELLSYAEAIDKAKGGVGNKIPKLSILLGNGFSRAYRDDIFSYDALLKRATFRRYGRFIRRVFSSLSTSDFERVIRLFVEMRVVLEGVNPKPRRIIDLLFKVEQVLKNALADTLAASHPDGPFVITDEEYATVHEFLGHFEDIYTLNYDLLLYWSLMHAADGTFRSVDDGFRNPDEQDCTYVTWEPENRLRQSVHYLHGALHIFDAGSEIKKFTWCRTGIRLKEQILGELSSNSYPLIITEGESSAKKAKIFHNIYLASSYKSLLAKSGVLFVYGASLQEHDEHILRALKENKTLKAVYYGVFGDPTSPSTAATIARVQTLGEGPHAKEVHFFDAKTAKVWR